MFSKAVLTFLAIGALSVNVSATPISISPRSPVPDMQLGEKIASELPRLFIAPSYRHLTFVSSVVGATAVGATGLGVLLVHSRLKSNPVPVTEIHLRPMPAPMPGSEPRPSTESDKTLVEPSPPGHGSVPAPPPQRRTLSGVINRNGVESGGDIVGILHGKGSKQP